MDKQSTPHFPKITARTIEQFKEIEEKIKLLPQKIIDQIEVVSSQYKIMCYLSEMFDASKYVFLPHFTTQIKTSFKQDTGLDITIYADDYIFKIDWKRKRDAVINYQFFECDNFKKK